MELEKPKKIIIVEIIEDRFHLCVFVEKSVMVGSRAWAAVQSEQLRISSVF